MKFRNKLNLIDKECYHKNVGEHYIFTPIRRGMKSGIPHYICNVSAGGITIINGGYYNVKDIYLKK